MSYFATGPTQERPAKLSAWMFLKCAFLTSLPTLYKPTLPMKF